MKHPVSLTTDIVLFTVRHDELQVLLVRRAIEPFKGRWALPGGFVLPGETLEACASRELAEEAGLRDVYLEQLYTFGAPERDPRGRVVTVAYFALVPSASLRPVGGSDASEAAWFPARACPPLAFDHVDIVSLARQRLIAKLGYSTIALQLLPERFTLSECQRIFEIVLGHSLEKSAFRRRLRDAEIIEQIPDAYARGSNRPAALYRLRPGKETIFFPGVLRGGQSRSS